MSIVEHMPAPAADQFYVTGGTLPSDAASYVPRQADHDLLQGLTQGEFCYVLNTRQMGKSSLMVRTAQALRQQGCTVAVLDLTAVGLNLTPEQWYGGLLSSLGEQLHLEDALEDFWDDNATLGPLQRFISAIGHVVLPGVSQRLVLFVDEIDAVRSLPFPADEFFAAIRECYNRRRTDPVFEKLTFCLLGVATPADLIQDTRLSPFNIGRRILLTDFTPAEASPLAQGLPGGQPTLDRVLYWTGGHPYMTQRLCRAVAEAGIASASGVDAACEGLFLTKQARESDDNLAFVRARLLRSEADLASLLDLYVQVRSGRRVKDDETNPLCGVLRLSGVVNAPDGFLRVRNRIYDRVFDREWVLSHMPDAELRRQRAAYRRGLLRAAAAAAVVLLFLGLLAGWAVVERSAAQQALGQARRETSRANHNLYAADMNLVQSDWTNNKISELAALLKATQASPYRGFEWGVWNRFYRFEPIVMTLTGHGDIVSAVAYSPDGRCIVTGNQNYIDSNAKVWDARTGRELLTLPVRSYINSVAFSPDSRRIVTGSTDGTAKVWDASTGQPLLTLRQHRGSIRCAAFFPDGRRIITGGDDGDHHGVVHLWDARTGHVLLTIHGNGGSFRSVALSPNGRQIVIGSDDDHDHGIIQVWDARTGQPLLTLQKHGPAIESVAYSPDGRRIVTGDWDGNVQVWNARTGQLLTRIQVIFSTDFSIISVAYSPDNRFIVTGSDDGVVRVWDARTGQEMLALRGHDSAVYSVAFSPNGRRIVTGSADGTAKIWDARTSPLLLPQYLTFRDHRGAVSSIEYSPDGRRIATGDWNGDVQVWNARTGQPLAMFHKQGNPVLAVAYSPDGGRIVTGCQDGVVRLWNAVTGQALLTLRGHDGAVNSVAFSPDGRRIVTGNQDGTAKVWDANTGQMLLGLKCRGSSVYSVAFSPDGRRIVTGSDDGTAQVWNANTGQPLLTLQRHEGVVYSAAFSPNGQRIVTSSNDHTATVWDANTGQALLTLSGHGGTVTSAAFSPDGCRIITGSIDGTIKIWDTSTGQAVLTFKYGNIINAVAFSPDGHCAAIGSNDGHVHVLFSDMNVARITPRGGNG